MVVRPQDNCIRLGNVVVSTFGHDLLPNQVWLANCGQRPALKGTFEKALVDSGGAKLRVSCRALALTFTEESIAERLLRVGEVRLDTTTLQYTAKPLKLGSKKNLYSPGTVKGNSLGPFSYDPIASDKCIA